MKEQGDANEKGRCLYRGIRIWACLYSLNTYWACPGTSPYRVEWNAWMGTFSGRQELSVARSSNWKNNGGLYTSRRKVCHAFKKHWLEQYLHTLPHYWAHSLQFPTLSKPTFLLHMKTILTMSRWCPSPMSQAPGLHRTLRLRGSYSYYTLVFNWFQESPLPSLPLQVLDSAQETQACPSHGGRNWSEEKVLWTPCHSLWTRK